MRSHPSCLRRGIPFAKSLQFFDLASFCGTNNRLGHSSAVHHFLESDGERSASGCGCPENFQDGAHHIETFAFPDFGLSFDGLEFTGAEQLRASFFG